MKPISITLTALACVLSLAADPAPKGWPQQVQSIKYPTSIDKSLQPMLVYSAVVLVHGPIVIAAIFNKMKLTVARRLVDGSACPLSVVIASKADRSDAELPQLPRTYG